MHLDINHGDLSIGRGCQNLVLAKSFAFSQQYEQKCCKEVENDK
jgi:hypothetical protein